MFKRIMLIILLCCCGQAWSQSFSSNFASGLAFPVGMALDSANNLYVGAWDSNKIFKYAASSGSVAGGASPATHASLTGVTYIQIDSAGNLYASAGSAVHKYAASGGVPGASGVVFVNGFNSASGMVFDANGNMYVGDSGDNKIYKVTSAGSKSELVASVANPQQLALDASNNLYVVSQDGNKVIRYAASAGNVSGASPSDWVTGLNTPTGIALDTDNNLYVLNQGGDGSIYKFPAAAGLVQGGVAGAGNLVLATNAGATINPQALLFVSPNLLLLSDANSPTGYVHQVTLAASTYTVTYDGNGNTGGSVPVDGSSPYASASSVTVANVGSLSKTGYSFTGWNTAANGSGTARAAGDSFSITANTTLFAQWVAVPGAPTIGSATAGSGSISVAFTAPASDGGSAITGYTASCTSSDGGASGNHSGASSPISVSGLTNGKSYTCTVVATNTIGTGNASAASSSAVPKASQSISFTGPANQNFGASPSLSATASSGLTVVFSSATTSICTVSGNSVTLVASGSCTINANQAGDSTYLAASQVQQSFTVAAIAPDAPSIGSATAGSGSISIAFTAPASDGGSAITGYTASCTSSDGGASGNNTGASSPISVSGLTNGKTYTCTVVATNAIGTGNASAASASAVPKASQTISFTGPANQNFGASPSLSATATSGLTVVFSSATSSICTVSGNSVTLVASGSCTINANQAGDSAYLAASQVQQSFTVTAVAPAAPTAVGASGGDSSASVSFTAPASNGGSVITGYSATCTSSDGGASGNNTGAGSPISISGLTNGKTYTCTVTASNSTATSAAAVASSSFIPAAGPVVSSVAVPADGRYKAGSQLDFTVNWDSVTTVTGSPRLVLTVGSTTRHATYLSGSGSTASVFRHTVQAGDSDSDGISIGSLELNGGSIQDGSSRNASLGLNSVASTSNVLVDTTAPTLPAASIVVNNQSDPHRVILTFSEALASASLGSAAGWTVSNNGGTTTYSVASVGLSSGNIVSLTLNAVDLGGSTTAISNSAANGHLKVTPPATLTDVAGNAYAAGQVSEAGATHVLDNIAPTMSNVAASSPTSSGGSLAVTASEKAKGYWIAVTSGATAPTPAQVKAGGNYGAVSVVASGNGILPAGTAGSLSLSGLAAASGYDLYVMVDDAAGNPSATVGTASLTTTAAPVTPPSNGGTSSNSTTLPTGGGSASPTAGQTVIVTNNGSNGSTINLPTPPSSSGGATVTVSLPGTGNLAVSNNVAGTQLQVQTLTLPGSSTPVSTLVVTSGSANIVGQSSGQILNAIPASSGNCPAGTTGGYFEARSNNAQSNVLSVNQGSLALTGHVPQGVVAYHYTSAGSCNGFALSTPLDSGNAKEILIYQGEYVEIDKNGQPVKIIVRSQDGKGGAAGDPLTVSSSGLTVNTIIPRISQSGSLNSGRLPAGQSIAQSIESLLKLYNVSWTVSSQDSFGALRLSNSSGEHYTVLPVGQVLADAERPDGFQCYGNGLCQVTARNLSTRFNAGLDAPQAFIAELRKIDPAATVSLNPDGNLQVSLNGRTYLAQVSWQLSPSNGNGFSSDKRGLGFSSSSGSQTLYPVLANLDRLQTILKQIDASATALGDHQGGFTVQSQGQLYRLTPAWELISTPAAHANDDYWLDNGAIYINYLNGTAQGVSVK